MAGALLGLLPLAVAESDQRVQLLALLHLLLGGQSPGRPRIQADQIQGFIQCGVRESWAG